MAGAVIQDIQLNLDKDILRKIGEKVELGMNRACTVVQDDAKRHCPVDTGRLQGSISHEVTREGNDVVGIVGTDVEYAPFVELGTYKMRAQPYLFPAGERNKDKITQCFKDLV